MDSLDRYLWAQAGQDVRRKANGVFILVEADEPTVVLGYYTLCATSLQQGAVPVAARKELPRYPLVSATLVGRMAVSITRRGERLGTILLADAMRRTYTSAETVRSSMLVVDAIDERATKFYAEAGLIPLPGSLRLVLPMHTIQRLLGVEAVGNPPWQKVIKDGLAIR